VLDLYFGNGYLVLEKLGIQSESLQPM